MRWLFIILVISGCTEYKCHDDFNEYEMGQSICIGSRLGNVEDIVFNNGVYLIKCERSNELIGVSEDVCYEYRYRSKYGNRGIH